MWEYQFGIYHYSYVTSVENAKLEAQNCLKFIKDKEFDLPVFYDLEESSIQKLGKEKITECAISFCEEIESKGYKAGVYANLYWFNNFIDVKKLIDKGFKIWLAQWNDKITADFKVDFWQYTSKGDIHGIQGNVDLDICYYDFKNNTQPVEKPVENTNSQPVENSVYKIGKTYKTTVDLRVRTGAGTEFPQKLYRELTFNAKLHSYKQNFAVLKPNTKVTCLEIKKVKNDIWLRIPSRLGSSLL